VPLANKMTVASWCFRSVCEEDLDKVLNDQQIYAIKKLDDSLSISMRDR